MFQWTYWILLSQRIKVSSCFTFPAVRSIVCSNDRSAIYLFCFAFNQSLKTVYYSPWCQYYAVVSSCHSFPILTSCRLSSLCDPPPSPKPCHVTPCVRCPWKQGTQYIDIFFSKHHWREGQLMFKQHSTWTSNNRPAVCLCVRARAGVRFVVKEQFITWQGVPGRDPDDGEFSYRQAEAQWTQRLPFHTKELLSSQLSQRDLRNLVAREPTWWTSWRPLTRTSHALCRV